MGLFKNSKKVSAFSDIIRCDEPSYLIWKWHPDGTQLGEHKREYAIRYGSRLRVKDGEVAVFVYRQKSGAMQDFIVGPFDQKLKTANLPVLSGFVGMFFGGDTPFQAEVYFINLAGIIQTKFAVPFFEVSDPRYPDFSVPVAVRGTVTFKIDDFREFIKLHRLDSFDLDTFQEQIKDAVSRYVKGVVASAPSTYGIPVVQLDAKTMLINDAVEEQVKKRLKETFGVVVSAIDIGVIEIDKTSSGYAELVEITKKVTAYVVQEQTAINTDHYAETLRIQREEGQYAMHKGTQTANIGAYQIEQQAQVGIAGADALGKMGANGAGTVSLGNGVGFNPAAMMASMAVGGAVGRKMASVMDESMSGATVATPPPIPTITYFVAKNGQATGPFDIATLTKMVGTQELTRDSLVWKQGMSAWEKAGENADLKGLFPPVPPM